MVFGDCEEMLSFFFLYKLVKYFRKKVNLVEMESLKVDSGFDEENRKF